MSTGLSICSVGNSVRINATSTVSVANVSTGTNTFRFVNGNASTISFVGVFSNYAQAAAAAHPTAAVPNSLIPLSPSDSINVVGNFGINPNPGTVYLAVITQTDPATVYATPIAP